MRSAGRARLLGEDSAALRAEIARLEARIATLERRFLTYYRERYNFLDKLADYLVGAQLPGDYYEFGVAKGVSFAYAAALMGPLFPAMRFIACDSFEGLPEPAGVDAQGGYTSGFHAGEFACSEAAFRANIAAEGVDLGRVEAVPGWFNQTLAPGHPQTAALGPAAAAWIDCDLYESTIPVLDFLTPRLNVGAVLIFDDWRCFRNLPDRGEQRACAEWLARNPQIKLRPFVDFGFHGLSFTVEAC